VSPSSSSIVYWFGALGIRELSKVGRQWDDPWNAVIGGCLGGVLLGGRRSRSLAAAASLSVLCGSVDLALYGRRGARILPESTEQWIAQKWTHLSVPRSGGSVQEEHGLAQQQQQQQQQAETAPGPVLTGSQHTLKTNESTQTRKEEWWISKVLPVSKVSEEEMEQLRSHRSRMDKLRREQAKQERLER